jgi:serine protease AprX
MTAGIATLAVEAYRENNSGDIGPMELLNTINAESDEVYDSYTPYNVGAGFVDAADAVTRAESGNVASFDDVTLVN